jgi:HSP20 family protein
MYLSPYVQRHVRDSRPSRYPANVKCDVQVPMDVRAEKDSFILELVVPGLSPEDMEIEIVEDVVDIQGEFQKEENEDVKILRSERPTGKFHRRVRLPSVLDVNAAEAQLQNGILSLRIPKAEEALPRTVKVKAK